MPQTGAASSEMGRIHGAGVHPRPRLPSATSFVNVAQFFNVQRPDCQLADVIQMIER